MSSLVKSSNKIENFRKFWPKDHQNQPKMTISTCTKIFENLNLKSYKSDIAKTCSLCVPFNCFQLLKTEGVNQRDSTSEKTIKKCQEFIKILTLIWLKNSLLNAIRLWFFPVCNKTFTANILGTQEKRRGFIHGAQGFP